LEDNISEEERRAKINIDRKRSSFIEKDCFEKSHNCCSTGDRTTEPNIHIEHPVSTKTVRRELHRSNIHIRAATAKPLIIESNAQMRKRRCHDHETWTETTGSARVIWSDESSFTLLPASGRVYFWRTPKEAYSPECLVLTQISVLADKANRTLLSSCKI
jgi:hypothetical protein